MESGVVREYKVFLNQFPQYTAAKLAHGTTLIAVAEGDRLSGIRHDPE